MYVISGSLDSKRGGYRGSQTTLQKDTGPSIVLNMMRKKGSGASFSEKV